MIECGRFNKRIKVLSFSTITTDTGQNKEELTLFKTIWAEMHPLRGHELLEDDKIESKSKVKITCRFFSGLTEEMYIEYLNHQYYITSIADIDMKHRYYEIMCEENNKRKQKKET